MLQSKYWAMIFCMVYNLGLPIPVVIVSVAVSHEQYGTDRALVTLSCEQLRTFMVFVM